MENNEKYFSAGGYYIAQYKHECYDEDGNFDWEAYQELCDMASQFDDD